jgi:folate-binding protein YgfZ
LKVTGEDAASFLQGQFTNELRQPAGGAVYGLWLNQKGKIVADSHVLKVAEHEFLVTSDTSPVATISPRLESYIIADDVGLADETEATHGLALWGQGCGEGIKQVLGNIPAAGRFFQAGQFFVFPGRWVRGENYEIIGPAENIRALLARFVGAGAREAAAGAAEWARISAGIPAIPADLGPGDLPNEGGLDDVAISYTKGCYLGQEVMARLKNMGRVRRQLQVVQGTGVPPQPLDALYQGDRKIGEIRSVAVGQNEFRAMAMLSLFNLDAAAGLSLAPAAAPGLKIIPHG